MAIKYVNIAINDLAPRKRLPFPIYAQAKGSEKFVLYTKRGKVLTDAMREKMKLRTNFNYFIDAADIERFRNYLYNIVQTLDKAKKRERVIRRVHEALAIEEAFEQERRQPEFGKFPFIWWGLGIVLIAMLCANAGTPTIIAVAIGAVGGMIMSLILLALALAPGREAKEEKALAAMATIQCPHCRNKLPAPSVTCRFCGKQVMGQPLVTPGDIKLQTGMIPHINQSVPPEPPPARGAQAQRTTRTEKAAKAAAAQPAEHKMTMGPPNGMGIATGGVTPV